MFFSRRGGVYSYNDDYDDGYGSEDNCGEYCDSYEDERAWWGKKKKKPKKGRRDYNRDSDDEHNEREEEEEEDNDDEFEEEYDDEVFDDDDDRSVEFDISNPKRHRHTKKPVFFYERAKPEKKKFVIQLLPMPKSKPNPPKTTVIATETTIVAGPAELFKGDAEPCLAKTSKSLEEQQKVTNVYKKSYGGISSWTSLKSTGSQETVIQDIPDHVILNILKFIRPQDIVELRCTCKHIDFLMYNYKWFWEEFCKVQFGEIDKRHIEMSAFDGVTIDWNMTFRHNLKLRRQRVMQKQKEEEEKEGMATCPSCGEKLLNTKTYSRNVSSYVFSRCIGCGYSEQYSTVLHPFKI